MMRYQSFVHNSKISVVRHDTLAGRDCYVVPLAMMVEGVLNGSGGPLYYPGDELGKAPMIWNNVPIVVYHPMEDGAMISARQPAVMNSRQVGLVLNTKYDTKLRAEAWIYKDLAASVDPRIEHAILNEEMMEVSTSLYTDSDGVPGEFNGVEYVGVARNFKPDHLALLPDQVGACSIAAGAGLLQTNAEAGAVKSLGLEINKAFLATANADHAARIAGFVANELSHDQVRSNLYTAIRNQRGDDKLDLYLEEVYDDFCIYSCYGDGYVKQEYTKKGDVITLNGSGIDVRRVVSFVPDLGISTLTGNQGKDCKSGKKPGKGKVMKKDELVSNLIADENLLWSEADREALMGMNEDVLTKMVPVANKGEVKQTDEEKAALDAAAMSGAGPTVPATPATPVGNTQPVSLEQYVGAAPAQIRDVLMSSLSTLDAERSTLISNIKNNPANFYSDEQLKAKDVIELRGLAKLAAPVANESQFQSFPAVDYSGAGLGSVPVANTQGGPGEALALPKMF